MWTHLIEIGEAINHYVQCIVNNNKKRLTSEVMKAEDMGIMILVIVYHTIDVSYNDRRVQRDVVQDRHIAAIVSCALFSDISQYWNVYIYGTFQRRIGEHVRLCVNL